MKKIILIHEFAQAELIAKIAILHTFNFMKQQSIKPYQDVAFLEKSRKTRDLQILLMKAGIITLKSQDGFPLFIAKCPVGIFSVPLDVFPVGKYSLQVSSEHILL